MDTVKAVSPGDKVTEEGVVTTRPSDSVKSIVRSVTIGVWRLKVTSVSVSESQTSRGIHSPLIVVDVMVHVSQA